MDPQATWNEMLESLAGKDLFEAELRAEGLLDWLDRGGFPPQVTLRVLPAEWDRLLCRYLCRKVLFATQTSGE